jgi:excisionase family DNA binding protein
MENGTKSRKHKGEFQMVEENFLTVGEVAKDWNCSPDTVRRLAKQGLLPAIRVGREGHRLFKPADVKRLHAERQKKSESVRR